MMDSSRNEIVKCVVVGDRSAGKTRLILARACNIYVNLSQIFATHVPSVWAVDQYRLNKEVLRRSWRVVDGVNVSLRLWDTFGDHVKDRKYAYATSDVVVLCFSIGNRESLNNCKKIWKDELRYYCPKSPIVLVGCKNDLRHLYTDENLMAYCRRRYPNYKYATSLDELTTSEEGRQVAKGIGAIYYEASVLTEYGVEDVFLNAVRLALIARRKRRFFAKNLKNVGPPTPQKPYLSPSPRAPGAKYRQSCFSANMLTLLNEGYKTDVTVKVDEKVFQLHKIILVATSKYFHELLLTEPLDAKIDEEKIYAPFEGLSSSEMEVFVRFMYSGVLQRTNVDFRKLKRAAGRLEVVTLKDYLQNSIFNDEFTNFDARQKHFRSLKQNLNNICLKQGLFTDITFQLDDGTCSAHRSILMARCDFMRAMFGGNFKESSDKVVGFPGFTVETFKHLLYYIYCDTAEGKINFDNCLPVLELANMLGLPHLISLVENHIILDLSELDAKDCDASEIVLRLLEPSQLHNALQLAEWCKYYIIVHYEKISVIFATELRQLTSENQAYLSRKRWPPKHYLAENDLYYQSLALKVLEEEFREKSEMNEPKCGWLCFGKSKKPQESTSILSPLKQIFMLCLSMCLSK